MHQNLLTAAAAARGGLTQADSTTSLQRYEEHVSPFLTTIPRHLDPDDAASSQISILPPLTHPCQPDSNKIPASPSVPHRPAFPMFNRCPSAAGAEPGVHPRRDSSIAKYSLCKQECLIDVIDYNADDVNVERIGNAEFIGMMNAGRSKHIANIGSEYRPKAIRWINIGGIDWDVLSSLALRYNIHSLALEDVLHEHRDIQSKADYYPDHLFIRILCHSICPMFDSDDPGGCIKLTGPDYHLSSESMRKGTSRSRPTAPPAYAPADIEAGNSDPRNASTIPSSPQSERPSLPFRRSLELRTRFSGFGRGADSAGFQERITRLRALTAEDRLNVLHEPMFIFLFHDSTVVSIMPTLNLDFTAPITERLYHNQSVLRTSEDPSLLVQSLLDLVVDRILEVIDEYQMKIHKLEHDIMLNPKMDSVRSLHVLSGDLIMHKLTFEPIRTMIFNLRRYDVDRCIAMANNIRAEAETSDEQEAESDAASIPARATPKAPTEKQKTKGKNTKQFQREHSLLSSHWEIETEQSEFEPDSDNRASPKPPTFALGGMNRRTRKRAGARKKSQAKRDADKAERMRWESALSYMRAGKSKGNPRGYLSYRCKVYLGDVSDHMDFALTSLDMFAGISENLIDYAFNMASYETNQVMNRLTIVTIIFLPLTLLTGYFGMNFTPFSSLDGHTEQQFWRIAVPAMAALIPLFMFQDIMKLAKYASRRWKSRKATKHLS